MGVRGAGEAASLLTGCLRESRSERRKTGGKGGHLQGGGCGTRALFPNSASADRQRRVGEAAGRTLRAAGPPSLPDKGVQKRRVGLKTGNTGAPEAAIP